MQTKANLFRNITIAALFASTVILLGCQKHEDLSEQDAAMANADRSAQAAQAAQAATDAATAAVPAESAVTPTASATSEISGSMPVATKTAS